MFSYNLRCSLAALFANMILKKKFYIDQKQYVCNYTHVDSRKIIKIIKRHGWIHVRTTGDHWHFYHPEKAGIVTVPHPKKDIAIGTLKSIEKQADIKLK